MGTEDRLGERSVASVHRSENTRIVSSALALKKSLDFPLKFEITKIIHYSIRN